MGREKAPKPDSSAMKKVAEYLKGKVDSSKTKVEKKDGKIVKNSSQVKAGQKLSTRFATGSASVKVIDKS